MANGQITIHQSHLPHHFFVSVPVDLAAAPMSKRRKWPTLSCHALSKDVQIRAS